MHYIESDNLFFRHLHAEDEEIVHGFPGQKEPEHIKQ